MSAQPPPLDPAFLPLSELMSLLMPDLPDLVDPDLGVVTTVTGIELEAPVELDVVVDAAGRVTIGGTPPLYHLETSSLPVFHHVRFSAVREDASS